MALDNSTLEIMCETMAKQMRDTMLATGDVASAIQVTEEKPLQVYQFEAHGYKYDIFLCGADENHNLKFKVIRKAMTKNVSGISAPFPFDLTATDASGTEYAAKDFWDIAQLTQQKVKIVCVTFNKYLKN